jgi:hypothetical protein
LLIHRRVVFELPCSEDGKRKENQRKEREQMRKARRGREKNEGRRQK